MNSRFRLVFIRHLASKAHQNKGFALAVAAGVGLAVIGVGLMMMVGAQQNQEEVQAQNIKAESLSAAEIGVARVQNVLNDYRELAMYNASSWGGVLAPGTDPLKSKFTAVKFCSNGTEQTRDLTASPSSLYTFVTDFNNSNIFPIVPNDPKKGKYQLVQYTYSNVGNPNGEGTLLIKGITGEGVLGESTTNLEVKFGVVNDDNGGEAPGLWLKKGDMAKVQGSSVQDNKNGVKADVWLQDCSVSAQRIQQIQTLASAQGPYEVRQMPQPDMPPLPKTLSEVQNKLGSNTDENKLVNWNNNNVITLDANGTNFLPPSTGATNVTYEYAVSSLDVKNLTIRPGYNVTLHLLGNIEKGTEIIHNCVGSTNCKPTNFQVFGYGNVGRYICLNGNNQIEGFILAPNYAVANNGKGRYKGSVWARSWNKIIYDNNTVGNLTCDSSDGSVVIEQTARWTDLSPSLQPAMPIRLTPIRSWRRVDN